LEGFVTDAFSTTSCLATDAPTNAPTDAPTDASTDAPTDAPTNAPTDAVVPLTDAPTDAPTHGPSEVVLLDSNTNGQTFSYSHVNFRDSGDNGDYSASEDYHCTFDAGAGQTWLVQVADFVFEHTNTRMYDRLGIQSSLDGIIYQNINVPWMQQSSDIQAPWTNSFSAGNWDSAGSSEGWILPENVERATTLGYSPGTPFSIDSRYLRFSFISDSSTSDDGWDIELTSHNFVPTDAPTNAPTDAPTNAPTDAPTNAPTNAPTDAGAPTDAPTHGPSEVVLLDSSTNGQTFSYSHVDFRDSGGGDGDYSTNEDYHCTFDAGAGQTWLIQVADFVFEHSDLRMYDRLGIQSSLDGIIYQNIQVPWMQSALDIPPPWSNSFGGTSWDSAGSSDGWILPENVERATALGYTVATCGSHSLSDDCPGTPVSVDSRYLRFTFISDGSLSKSGWDIKLKSSMY
jgi:hypothetical protein